MSVQQEVAAYRRAATVVRTRVLALVMQAWGGLGAWSSPADVERFLDQVVPVVLAGQRQVGALTEAYLARVLSEMLGEPPRLRGLPEEALAYSALRGGVAPEGVYHRPFVSLYTAMRDGKSRETAVREAGHRLDATVHADLQLAERRAALTVVQREDRVVGYRRVVSGVNTCGLCLTASSQHYHRDDLMPIHARCGCSVLPIVGQRDPGQTINAALYRQVTERTGGKNDRASLSKVRTDLHGELGPVLNDARFAFTSAADLAA